MVDALPCDTVLLKSLCCGLPANGFVRSPKHGSKRKMNKRGAHEDRTSRAMQQQQRLRFKQNLSRKNLTSCLLLTSNLEVVSVIPVALLGPLTARYKMVMVTTSLGGGGGGGEHEGNGKTKGSDGWGFGDIQRGGPYSTVRHLGALHGSPPPPHPTHTQWAPQTAVLDPRTTATHTQQTIHVGAASRATSCDCGNCTKSGPGLCCRKPPSASMVNLMQ